MTREAEVIEKARTWRRTQKAKKQAATPAEKESAKSAEFHALRKLGNAVDSLEKESTEETQQFLQDEGATDPRQIQHHMQARPQL